MILFEPALLSAPSLRRFNLMIFSGRKAPSSPSALLVYIQRLLEPFEDLIGHPPLLLSQSTAKHLYTYGVHGRVVVLILDVGCVAVVLNTSALPAASRVEYQGRCADDAQEFHGQRMIVYHLKRWSWGR